jgi:hypothetical protein
MLALGGCLERTIHVTSDPPGALVYLNDVEIGRTPVETSFLYFGTYDVRLRLDGYEPIVTSKRAKAPIYEMPGPDLLASAWPGRISTDIRWHFDLTPAPTGPEAEADLLDRARSLRQQLGVEPAGQ